MKPEQFLENQLCFPIYTLARLIGQEYTPLLKPYNLTYTQYLVLMVLWEEGSMKVNDISKKLLLETSTITPLLKRLEAAGYIVKTPGMHDSRVKLVTLTSEGKKLQNELKNIPCKIESKLKSSKQFLKEYKNQTEDFIKKLNI